MQPGSGDWALSMVVVVARVAYCRWVNKYGCSLAVCLHARSLRSSSSHSLIAYLAAGWRGIMCHDLQHGIQCTITQILIL